MGTTAEEQKYSERIEQRIQRLKSLPWWMDAQFFLPFVFGPVAFMIVIVPGLVGVLSGRQDEIPQQVLIRGLLYFVLFSFAGFFLGKWICLVVNRFRNRSFSSDLEEERAWIERKTTAISLGIDQLEAGMKAAEPVLDTEGRQLLPKGALVTADQIESLRAAGIDSVRIEGVKYVTPEGQPPAGASQQAAARGSRIDVAVGQGESVIHEST